MAVQQSFWGAYATDSATLKIRFWPMVLKNTGVFFLGSDDFRKKQQTERAQDLNVAPEAASSASRSASEFLFRRFARAHEFPEHP